MKNLFIILCSEEQKKPVVQTQKVESETKVTLDKHEEPTMSDMIALMKGFQEQNQLLVAMLKEKGTTAKQDGFDLDKFGKIMEAVVRKQNDNSVGRTFGIQPINVEEIDPADILEVPAYFFSYSYKYAVYDDVKNGQPINPPYGAVKFNPLFRSSPTGKVYGTAARYSNISYALIYSKKQADWLKKHSLFGVQFFENIGQAKSVDYLQAESIAKAYQSVQGLQGHQLRHRCVAEKIDISSIDDSVMRQKLIDKISKRLMEENEEIKQNNLKSSLRKEVETINFGGSSTMSSKSQ